MVRSPASIRGRAASTRDGASSTGDDSPSGGVLRKLLLGLGVATVAYVAVRKFRSGGQSSDDSDDWYQLSIEESVEGGAGGDEAGASDEETATASTRGDSTDEGVDPEIEQRTEENVEAESAKPGEMNVDEEVVEEVIEDDGADETDGAE